jgi:uncharacterized repeat protein (TIGR02543 family)
MKDLKVSLRLCVRIISIMILISVSTLLLLAEVNSHVKASSEGKEILFIDSNVNDKNIITDGIKSRMEVVFLSDDGDGLNQISEVLLEKSNLKAIHVISHGSPGKINIGNASISLENLELYDEQLSIIGDSLQVGGDLLFYGCDVGKGEGGQLFLQALSESVGADVAGSLDLTSGNPEKGNAFLEVNVGEIQTQPINFNGWNGVLPNASKTVYLEQEVSLTAFDLGYQNYPYVYFESVPGAGSQLGIGSASNTIGPTFSYSKSTVDSGQIKFKGNKTGVYTFQVRWTSGQGINTPIPPYTNMFTITIIVQNRPPSDITLSSTKAPAGLSGVRIGNLTGIDSSDDSNTFTIINDPNNLFEVSTLNAANKLGELRFMPGKSLAADASASVTIRVTDSVNNIFDKTFTITGVAPINFNVNIGATYTFTYGGPELLGSQTMPPEKGDIKIPWFNPKTSQTEIYRLEDGVLTNDTLIYTAPSVSGIDIFALGELFYVVTILDPATSPVITTQPSNATVIEGGNVNFVVSATGSGLTYQWQVNQGSGFTNISNGGKYTGVSTNTLAITGTTLNMNNYSYRVVVTGVGGLSTNSNPATLTVNAATALAPQITVQPISVNVIKGEAASFNVAAVSQDGGTLSYQWQKSTNGGVNWSNIVGATSANYSTVELSSGVQFRCIITNTKNITTASTTTNIVVLTLQYTVNFNVDGGSFVPNQTINHGGKVTKPTDPTKVGHSFVGWYSDAGLQNAFDFNTSITEGKTLYAKWQINSYPVTFNSNGGTTVPNQSIVYNQKATTPTAPTRVGHTFEGWYSDSGLQNAFDFNTPITGATTLYASWSINSYPVSFESNGGTNVTTQTINYNQKATKPADPIKAGHTFVGWYSDAELLNVFDFNTSITEAKTLYAKWQINSFPVTFNSNGGTTVPNQSIVYNQKARTPTAPTRVGHTFEGWYSDSGLQNAFDFNTLITGATTLYASWSINSYPVSFESNGGTTVAMQTINFNQKATKPADPTRFGYTFVGWYSDAALQNAYDFNTLITEVKTLYASWSINSYPVTFNSNGGTPVADQSIVYNQKATSPTAPTRVGHTFVGWYSDAGFQNTFDFNTLITGATTLYASWSINSYPVSFESNGGTTVAMQTINFNQKATKPADPTRFGYTFVGWYSDAALQNAYDFNTLITEVKTLYASWSINSYPVTFNSNGGTPVADQSIVYNQKATSPTAPTRVGHTFEGWYSDSGLQNAFDFNPLITGATTLYASWSINSYPVSFESNGGTNVTTQTINYNQKATKPADPTKVGHSFVGWYSDAGLQNAFDFNTSITEGKTLYAKWQINSYTVTFNSNGGTLVADQSIVYNQKAITPTAPTRVGHTFEGWYSDSGLQNAFDFNTLITGATTLYASWSINSYPVSFESNGGTNVTTQTINYNQKAIKPADPIKAGHTFVGWYSDAELQNNFDFNSLVTEAKTLYASWSINSYPVTFNSNGGTPVADQSIVYNQKATSPTAPTRVGHTFVGWYNDAAFQNAFDFNTPITGVITLYANWSINSYPVSFESNGGTNVTTQTINYNQKATKPADPIKAGHTFVGWYSDTGLQNAFDFNTLITEGKTLYAKWQINSYPVTFNSNGGTPVADQSIVYNQKATSPTAPTRVGHTFVGWYSDAGFQNTFDFNTLITGATTLYANWSINSYPVSFESNGGTNVITQTIDYNQKATKPADPIKAGHTFVGWYSDAELLNVFDFNTSITEGKTLYAKWQINSYPVTFNSSGGTPVADQSIVYNQKATTPTAPTRVGHTFEGWYSDSGLQNAFDFNTLITGATTLYASWSINSYPVSFESNGGTTVAMQTINFNQKATKPADPTRFGYTFVGWYSDAALQNAYDFNTLITEVKTLYASWSINSYPVTFNSNGGTPVADQSIVFNQKATIPSAPTRVGHTFVGWYSDTALQNAFDFNTPITGATTLYANWSINSYPVTFNSNGGSVVADQSIFYNESAIRPLNPTRESHSFEGWYSDESLKNAFNFNAPITQATNLHAKWVRIPSGSTGSTRQGDVGIGNGTTTDTTARIDITRQTANNKKVDQVELNDYLTKDTLNKALAEKRDTVGIFISDLPNDLADEIAVNITNHSVGLLSDAKVALDIQTDDVKIQLPPDTIQGLNGNSGDLFFRVIPIRNEEEKSEVISNTINATIVREVAGNNEVLVLGKPMTIETNYQNLKTKVTFSLKDISLPVDLTEREEFLKSLAIFIQHSDGEKVVNKGSIVYDSTGKPIGIEIEITKFSTFTIIHIGVLKEENEDLQNLQTHLPYINGYGKEFRPEAFISRAQMATLLARNLSSGNPAKEADTYVDISENHWAFNDIMKAREAGIMLGITITKFNPEGAITRAEMATIAYRWIKQECVKDGDAFNSCGTLIKSQKEVYKDVSSTHWALEAISFMKTANIMSGYHNQTFKPEDRLTRAQAVKVLNRIFKRGPLMGVVNPTFIDVPLSHWAFNEIEEGARRHQFINGENGEELIKETE